MAKQSISISVETELLEVLDQELRQSYRQLGQLEGGDLEAAAEDGVAMGSESLGCLAG